MRQHCGAVAFALLAALGFAIAGEGEGSTTGRPGSAPVAATSMPHQFTLTPAQERSIYRSVASELAQPALPDFQPELGATLPDIVMLRDLPSGLAADIPHAKDYKFAKLHDQVLLVDPYTKRVLEIINPPIAGETTGRSSGDR
jgi:hypothetical protein